MMYAVGKLEAALNICHLILNLFYLRVSASAYDLNLVTARSCVRVGYTKNYLGTRKKYLFKMSIFDLVW